MIRHLPLLLLDVDGVLSPLSRSQVAWPDVTGVETAPYVLRLSRAMGDALAELAVERRWLTSWDHLANLHVAPHFGWEPLAVVAWPGGPAGPRPNRFKATGLRDHLVGEDAGRPVIWVDDMLVAGGELRVRGERVLLGRPHLLIAPDPEVGLTRGHIDRMRDFCLRHGG